MLDTLRVAQTLAFLLKSFDGAQNSYRADIVATQGLVQSIAHKAPAATPHP